MIVEAWTQIVSAESQRLHEPEQIKIRVCTVISEEGILEAFFTRIVKFYSWNYSTNDATKVLDGLFYFLLQVHLIQSDETTDEAAEIADGLEGRL